MARPGPGQIINFAQEVKDSWDDSPRAVGVRTALSWALGERNEHPLTNRRSKKYPPDINAITKVAREARAVIRRPSRLERPVDPECCRGVWECLSWIYRNKARRPRP